MFLIILFIYFIFLAINVHITINEKESCPECYWLVCKNNEIGTDY